MPESTPLLSETPAEHVSAGSAYLESKVALEGLVADLAGKKVAISGFPTMVTLETAGSIKSPTPFRSTYPLRRRFAQTPEEPQLYQFANDEVLKVVRDGLTIAAHENSESTRKNNVIAYYFPLASVVHFAEVPVVEI